MKFSVGGLLNWSKTAKGRNRIMLILFFEERRYADDGYMERTCILAGRTY